MKKLIIPFFLLLVNQFSLAQNIDSLYKEIGEASVQVRSNKDGASSYSTLETNYRVQYAQLPNREYQQYLAKLKSSTTVTLGREGQDRTIELTLSPLHNPSEVALSAKHEGDDIEFHSGFYKTIKHACCTGLAKVRFFDYSSKEIIEGSDKVITASIPDNKTVLYFAYSDSNLDYKTTLGRITLSYGSGQRYNINLLSDKPLPELTCPFTNPKIELVSPNKKDTEYDSNHDSYYLWSLQEIKSPSDINKISLKVSFTCDKTMKPFIIPIINGLPFGKDQKEQSYNVRRN